MCATLFSGFFYLLSSPSPAVLSLTCPLPLKLITENFLLIVLFFHLWIPVNTTRPTLLTPPNNHRSRFPHPHPLSPSLRAYPAPSTKTAADKNTEEHENFHKRLYVFTARSRPRPRPLEENPEPATGPRSALTKVSGDT